eukprot:1248677-Prymnesium_polylepis.1
MFDVLAFAAVSVSPRSATRSMTASDGDLQPAWIINLPAATARWANVSAEFSREGIPFSRLPNPCNAPADGMADVECSLLHIDNHTCEQATAEETCSGNAVSHCAGACGCRGKIGGIATSHMRAWAAALDAAPGAPWFLFSEDDARLHHGHASSELGRTIGQATATTPNWRIVWFSGSKGCDSSVQCLGLYPLGLADEAASAEWGRVNALTQAWSALYALSNAGLRGLLGHIHERGFSQPIDNEMALWCDGGSRGECFMHFASPASGVLSHDFSQYARRRSSVLLSEASEQKSERHPLR